MERKTLARGLVVSALACLGFFLAMGTAQAQDQGETTVQGSQSSFGSAAATGGATGLNNAQFNGGPSAIGAASASTQQLGSNEAAISQTGEAKTGDPVAGGQVTGAVADNVTVQNSNSSIGAVAVAGNGAVVNNANARFGPQAASAGPAQTSQVGDNDVDFAQAGLVETGDAVAGSQVTGIVGGGEHTVSNQNTSILGLANLGQGGNGIVLNIANAAVGPTALSIGLTGQTSQVGDNDAALSQANEVNTGDALAGAQVTGAVGGSLTAQHSNSPIVNVATSGNGIAANALTATVAPAALSAAANAQASQSGNNTVDVAQDIAGETGDAVAGSQVTGAVGDQGGFLVVQNQQASTTGDFAVSGSFLAVAPFGNTAGVNVGPFAVAPLTASVSQSGDNDVALAQAIEAETGDALGGAQVTGDVGHTDVTISNSNIGVGAVALSGTVLATNVVTQNSNVGPQALGAAFASTSQLGDNVVSFDQAVAAETGDAVAGGQVAGAVATDGATVTIQQSNVGLGNIAVTGNMLVAQIGLANVGPRAIAALAAQAQQTGDNIVAAASTVEAATGDAVAGGQVSGVVAGAASDITISNQNTGIQNASVSGTPIVINVLTATIGPIGVGALTSSVSQFGDNALSALVSVEATSGDAVAGAQVTGVVAGSGSDAVIQGSNSSLGNISFTGPVLALNSFTSQLGPFALAIGPASASQFGSNGLEFAQDLVTESGDAVSGSQVSGVVGVTDATISVQNTDFVSVAFSGQTLGLNNASGNLTASAISLGLTASASQAGDTFFAGGQSLLSENGDAIAGAQINGEVGASSPALSATGVL